MAGLSKQALSEATLCRTQTLFDEHRLRIYRQTDRLFGGLIAVAPIALAIFRPGTKLTRHTIAVCQMLTSGLLISLTGGRIETHFHVFGSLALLAFYRDWPVLISATVVTAI